MAVSSSTVLKIQNPFPLSHHNPHISNNLPNLALHFNKFTSRRPPLFNTLRCAVSITNSTTIQMDSSSAAATVDPDTWLRPNSFGKFGEKYVPETLMHALFELEIAFDALATDEAFQTVPTKFVEKYIRTRDVLPTKVDLYHPVAYFTCDLIWGKREKPNEFCLSSKFRKFIEYNKFTIGQVLRFKMKFTCNIMVFATV